MGHVLLLFLPLLLVQPHSWNAIVVSKFNAFGRKRCLNGHQLREACRYLSPLSIFCTVLIPTTAFRASSRAVHPRKPRAALI
jgi:hypothetical protein